MTRLSPLRLLFLIALAALPGCTALGSLDSASAPLVGYELTPLPAGAAQAATARHLRVEVPTATGALATDRIMIRPGPREVQYLPGVRWVDEATDHMQLLLVRSIAGTGRFGLVSGPGAGPLPDLVLLTDLEAFQAETDATRGASVSVAMTLTLLRDTDGRILATRRFAQRVAIADLDTPRVVAGFDAATLALLAQAVPWVVSQAR